MRFRSPSIFEYEFTDRTSPHWTMRTSRSTKGDARREGYLIGNVEQLFQLSLHCVVPHRQHSAIPEGSRCKKQVLTRGIDRCSFVRVRCSVTNETDEDDNGNFLEMVHVVLHRSCLATLG
jgi:hypothetical protein